MSAPPTASVIVPAHDRPAALRRCLDALAAQRHDSFEAIVVDDGGSAPIEPILEVFAPRIEIDLIRQPRTGPAGARNLGASRARGSVLAFTDDDCRPDPDWLRRLVERCDGEPGAGAGGRMVNELRSDPWPEVAQLVVDLGYATFNRDPADARFFASSNLALPAAGFHAVGGFDPSFTAAEDRDLCDRWTASGRRLLSAPDAVVRHAHQLDLRAFFLLHMAYGRGAYRFHRAHARRTDQRGLGRGWVDAPYYRRAVRAALRGTPTSSAPMLALRMGVWQAANTIGFTNAMTRDLMRGPRRRAWTDSDRRPRTMPRRQAAGRPEPPG